MSTWTPCLAFASSKASSLDEAWAWKGRRRYSSGHSHQPQINICKKIQSTNRNLIPNINQCGLQLNTVCWNSKEKTSDFASSIEEAIASNAARPSTNHWAWLPSSVKPLGGAKEPKRWGWHQPSGGLRPASLIAATQSLTLAPLLVLTLMLRFPQVTWSFELFVRIDIL